MMTRSWKMGFKALGLSLVALTGTASAQLPDASSAMDALDDLQGIGRTVFKLVDENNDGQISQKEAVDAANLGVGGLFFRADANGDGVLSPEEARQARDSFLSQKPLVKFMIERAAGTKPGGANGGSPNPAAMFLGFVDSNNDKQLQATEVRAAIQTGVQALFAAADTNRDGLMSPTEVNAAIAAAAKAAEQASFQAADANSDGQISKDEFTRALTDPANAAFAVLDANNDGQLSPQELQSAGKILEGQVKKTIVPEPANSLRNLIRTGQKPEQVAPVPNVTIPKPVTPPTSTPSTNLPR